MTIYKRPIYKRLSEDTIRSLRAILADVMSGNEEQISSCLEDVEIAATSPFDREEFGDPKEMKRKYRATLKAISGLELALDAFDVAEIETLSDLIEGYEDDPILSKFDENPEHPGSYGYTIWVTREHLSTLKAALNHSIERIKVNKGAKPNQDARDVACFVADELRNHDIKVTAYDDGTYFRILEILFSDLFPELGDNAHMRYGRLGVQDDYDDHGIKYLPPGTVGT